MSTSPPLIVADRYRLIAPLGQGGMGRVWRATDVVLHREVAIKELVPPPGLTPEERQEMRERSLREARAIARLNNINVVRVFDVLRTDADPWIVMEYVPSRSLQDVLAADGPFAPVRAAEIGLGVLNALRAAHRAGVVHRDVKPGNVLIGEDGRVVLTDFGLATVPGDPNVTRTGLVLGSPAYIAPERARDGTAGPGADLWSLGATLYAAVEGASPFARPSAIATLAALATENPPPARNAGPLKPVLNGLLRKDPAHRINAEEAERLLLRATGRRSKLSFPMSPTMRRPGIGRERPAAGSTPPVVPGVSASAPVVPGQRPPVIPGRPQANPGQPPVSPARPPAYPARPPVTPGRSPVSPARSQGTPARPPVNPGQPPAGPPAGGRAPIFAPGKASVGRPPAETPTRVDGPKPPELDATKIENPNRFGTGTPSSPPSGADASASRRPALDATMRGSGSAFGSITADEVAAHRKRAAAQSAPATTPPTTAPESRQPTAQPPKSPPPAPRASAAGAAVAEPDSSTRPPTAPGSTPPRAPATGRFTATSPAKPGAPRQTEKAAPTGAAAAPPSGTAPATARPATPGSGTPGSGTPGSGTPGSGTPGSGTAGGDTPGSADSVDEATSAATADRKTAGSRLPFGPRPSQAAAAAPSTENKAKLAGEPAKKPSTDASPTDVTEPDDAAQTSAGKAGTGEVKPGDAEVADTSKADSGVTGADPAETAGAGADGARKHPVGAGTPTASEAAAGTSPTGAAAFGAETTTPEAAKAGTNTRETATDSPGSGSDAPDADSAEAAMGVVAHSSKTEIDTDADPAETGIGAGADSSQAGIGAGAGSSGTGIDAGGGSAKAPTGANTDAGTGSVTDSPGAVVDGSSDSHQTGDEVETNSSGSGSGTSAGSPEGGTGKAGSDAGSPEAGTGEVEAGTGSDAGSPEGGTGKAGSDAGSPEAGTGKAGTDAGSPQAGVGKPEAGAGTDTDSPEAGTGSSGAGTDGPGTDAGAPTPVTDAAQPKASDLTATTADDTVKPGSAAAGSTTKASRKKTRTRTAAAAAAAKPAAETTTPSSTEPSATPGAPTAPAEAATATDGMATEGPTTDGKATDGKATDGQATDGQATDGQATDSKLTSGEAPADQPSSNEASADADKPATTASAPPAPKTPAKPKAGKDSDAGPATVIAEPDAGRTRIIKPAAAAPIAGPRPDPARAEVAPVSGASTFGQPSRPAWQPMTVRAPSSGGRGITVFGTTLTRRQTAIAIGVLVAVLLALVVLVPRAFGDESDDQAGNNGRQAGVPPVASAEGKPSAGSGSAPAVAPTTDAPTAPPSAPVSSAAVSKPPAVVRVPKGWYLYEGDGYTVPVPNGVTVREQGTEVYFTKNNRLLIIDQTDQPRPDPVADWRQQEAERRNSKYNNYRSLGIRAINYHGKAADWEFTYTTSSGNPQHAVKRGFITTPGKQAFSISWYTSPDDWAAAQKDLQVIYQGFEPER